MAIGPTIENLRRKRADEAALLEMLYSLPTPTGGVEVNTPAERRQLAERGLRGGEPYSDGRMDYGRRRPNQGTIDVMPQQPAEFYAREVSRDILGPRATNDLFGYPQGTGTMVGDMLAGGGLLGLVGAKAPLTAWDAGTAAAQGNYGDAALKSAFSLLEGAGLGELATGARGIKAVASEFPEAAQEVGQRVRGFLTDESGSVPLPFSSSLPTPRNEAEAIAKEILEQRATGNVDAVTESMMDAADPQYMYDYTPLAMDEASRLARAREIGFGNNRYHGNNSEVSGFSGSVFSSDSPTVASTYNRGMLDAQIYPIMVRGGPMGDVTVEGAGSNWNQLSPKMVDDIAVARTSALYPDEITGKLSTRGIERAAKFEGRSGVTFKDISDLGPGFNSQQFKRLGYTPEQEAAMRQQYLTDLSKPSEVDVRLYPNLVRSRFARFDPMFAHLRNLSAGIAPFGLLALQPNEEQY